MITLQRLTADDWPRWRDVRLQALAEAPYAFSSTLSEWQGDGDTEARWHNRLSSVPFNIIAYLDGVAAGMVSATAPDAARCIELISMWIAPFARGRGAGDTLVRAVTDWARDNGMKRIELDVVEKSRNAIALYLRNGFNFTVELSACPNGERKMALDLSVQ